MGIEFSKRYMVIGLYLDRSHQVLQVYPIPWVRLSIYLGRFG